MLAEYPLQARDRTVSHGPKYYGFFRDIADDRRHELNAHAASGDYFITLATELDCLSQQLTETDPSAQIVIERIIADLEHLHARYQLARK